MLEIGQGASLSKKISEEDVFCFAGITGDHNSIHLNKTVAEKSKFKKRIVHGMLVGSLISAVLGTKFPGEGTVYVEQYLRFKAPVYYDDTLTAYVVVCEIINCEKGIYKLDTKITNQDGIVVIDGYAVIQYKD